MNVDNNPQAQPKNPARSSLWALWTAIVVVAGYGTMIMHSESQLSVISLILVGALACYVGARTGLTQLVGEQFVAKESKANMAAVVAVVVFSAMFYEDHFNLLMVATVLIYIIACLGLNIQFGFTGVLNFAGAAFFGAGGYTAAFLTMQTNLPQLLILLIGGLVAALIGCLLILPVLRTRGHYAAVVTIAFSLLFRTFVEVNASLGGAQGSQVKGMEIFGWNFNENIYIGPLEISFYANYVLFALILAVAAFIITKRIERSWVGLSLDSIRLDETASACFGMDIARLKITAFTIGNFFMGVAGAFYAMMLGFIAPNNFTFGDSLIMVSIILLGGIGNLWGVVLASCIVIILPEKLQAIQEYRFLVFAIGVMLILLFRPDGLLPRRLRKYFPDWRAQ